jgi:hypothetical protein
MVFDKSFVYTFRLYIHTKIHPPLHTHTHTHMSSSFLGALAILRRQLASSRVSVLLSTSKSSAPTVRIFTKFDIWVSFENLARKLKFRQNLTRKTSTLHEDLCTFTIISHWILLRMRNVLKTVVEKIKTRMIHSLTFLQKSCLLWDDVWRHRARQAANVNVMRRMRFAFWMPKATDTHLE